MSVWRKRLCVVFVEEIGVIMMLEAEMEEAGAEGRRPCMLARSEAQLKGRGSRRAMKTGLFACVVVGAWDVVTCENW